jgi:RNA ligase (TIGR02306 family)
MSYHKLAYIGKIVDIQPIKGADFIVSAMVVCGEGGKWQGTVKKDQFQVGDLCEVYLQDALLPKTEEFEFMANYKYRISMRKFKKVPSECLIMPLSVDGGRVGESIADLKGVTKYEKPISPSLAGMALGAFPTSIIPKTDEPNFQTVAHMIHALQGNKFYSTVKADGSSGTVYKTFRQDEIVPSTDFLHFGCCSRNLELKDEGKPAVWTLAKKYDLENILPEGYAIQFEIVGPGIQKNHMGLDEIDMRVFNLWDIKRRVYCDAVILKGFCERKGLPMVDIVDWDKTFDFTSNDDLRKYAEGKYPLSGKPREGVVIRPMVETKVKFERLSFKVINLMYKD